MFRFYGRPDNQPTPSDVRTEAPQGDGPPILIESAGSDLDRKYRLHLAERQTRDNPLRSRLADNAFDVFGAGFLVVKLCKRAGVEEGTGQSAVFR